ncbi:hypothetical protein Bra1253DRAFT_00088 [Bradyrhizobium sp. WSM1253]|nr:hypothetical protein Bra1253DRAFT_00088 [Bradyrhizobium sp. WSM1253]
MRAAQPSFLVLRQGLNAIATAIIRRAFAGAMLAQSDFRRNPHAVSRASQGYKWHIRARPLKGLASQGRAIPL